MARAPYPTNIDYNGMIAMKPAANEQRIKAGKYFVDMREWL